MKLVNGIAIYVVIIIGLSGCAPTDPSKTEVTLSGVVQKGPFSALKLTAYPVDESTAVLSQGIEAQVTERSYSVVVPINTPILLEATGSFTNELTGETVELQEPLQALVGSQTDDNTVNVNPRC